MCSQVAEEGISVPDVDLIIMQTPAQSAISSIQRKGRTGRSSRGKVINIVTKDTSDMYIYYSTIRKEKNMKNTLDNINKQQTLK